MSTVAEAERMNVRSVSIDCPHCNATQDGWLADPRDKTHECDDCGKSYRVPADIRLSF
jgi:transposase-like protein